MSQALHIEQDIWLIRNEVHRARYGFKRIISRKERKKTGYQCVSHEKISESLRNGVVVSLP